MTVTEYAKKYNVSKQSVYDKLKRGTLEYKVINGVKHIILNADIKGSIETLNKDIETISKKKYKRVLKKLNKSIQHIEINNEKIQGLENLLKSKENEISTLQKTLSAFTLILDNNLLPAPEVIETKIKSKKKNKKKK